MQGKPTELLVVKFTVKKLQARRIHTDVVFLNKIVNNILASLALLGFIDFHVPKVTTRNGDMFYLPVRQSWLLHNFQCNFQHRHF